MHAKRVIYLITLTKSPPAEQSEDGLFVELIIQD